MEGDRPMIYRLNCKACKDRPCYQEVLKKGGCFFVQILGSAWFFHARDTRFIQQRRRSAWEIGQCLSLLGPCRRRSAQTSRSKFQNSLDRRCVREY